MIYYIFSVIPFPNPKPNPNLNPNQATTVP